MALKFNNRIPSFELQHIEAISKIIGDTTDGLTGAEIGRYLQQCNISDTDSMMTKWKRLYNALALFQDKYKVGNHVIKFVNCIMNPSLYVKTEELFNDRRISLNQILGFSGYMIGKDGAIRKSQKISTIDEALEKANKLKTELDRRGSHSIVLSFCKAEIISENYFHAVLEAMKSITSRVREKSSVDGDGAQLMRDVFSGSSEKPVLAINDLSTKTLKGEQAGFLNLLIGLYGVIRNPVAHEAKIEWEMSEKDALDILTIISYIHRKLDNATSGTFLI